VIGRAVHVGDRDVVVGATDHENGLHAGAACVFELAPTPGVIEEFLERPRSQVGTADNAAPSHIILAF
jgi:hypothetical protein